MKKIFVILGFIFMVSAAFAQVKASAKSWQFAFSGDSRNCGDIVMPAIAKDMAKTDAKFYWHLGDLRAIFDFDEDIMNRAGAKRPSINDYENTVWQDMIVSQINYFKVPFF